MCTGVENLHHRLRFVSAHSQKLNRIVKNINSKWNTAVCCIPKMSDLKLLVRRVTLGDLHPERTLGFLELRCVTRLIRRLLSNKTEVMLQSRTKQKQEIAFFFSCFCLGNHGDVAFSHVWHVSAEEAAFHFVTCLCLGWGVESRNSSLLFNFTVHAWKPHARYTDAWVCFTTEHHWSNDWFPEKHPWQCTRLRKRISYKSFTSSQLRTSDKTPACISA